MDYYTFMAESKRRALSGEKDTSSGEETMGTPLISPRSTHRRSPAGVSRGVRGRRGGKRRGGGGSLNRGSPRSNQGKCTGTRSAVGAQTSSATLPEESLDQMGNADLGGERVAEVAPCDEGPNNVAANQEQLERTNVGDADLLLDEALGRTGEERDDPECGHGGSDEETEPLDFGWEFLDEDEVVVHIEKEE